MKLKTLYILGIFMFLLTSCGQRSVEYEYWDISKFNIDNEALEDTEEIKMLYSSRGPDFNREMKYYMHLIAVSQKTGDTVNILAPSDHGLTMDDKDKVFNFFNQDNIATKMLHSGLENIKDKTHIDDFDNVELKKINKVARDPNFDYIADNNYPTIIGSIGTMKKNKE